MRGDESYFKEMLHYLIPDKVIIYLNVLCASMKHRIGGQVLGAHIVTPQTGLLGTTHTKFSEKSLKPH
jgi:hypothetical protein